MEAKTERTDAKHVAVFENGRMMLGGLTMDEADIQEVLLMIPPVLLSEIAQESGGDPKVRYCLSLGSGEFLDEESVLVVFENSGTMIHIFADVDDEDDEDVDIVVGTVEVEKDFLRFAEIAESALIE